MSGRVCLRSVLARVEHELAFLCSREEHLYVADQYTSQVLADVELTKASRISMLLSFVWVASAAMSRFLATAATTIRMTSWARVWPPQILLPTPNGIMFCVILKWNVSGSVLLCC